jgi:hypothetical protein
MAIDFRRHIEDLFARVAKEAPASAPREALPNGVRRGNSSDRAGGGAASGFH